MHYRALGKAQLGASTLELALVLPVLLMSVMAILQLGLFLHAQNVVTAAVQDGARLAAEEDRSIAEGQAHARALLTAGLGRSARAVAVRGSGDRDSVTITVSGRYPTIIPWVNGNSLPLKASATMSRERFRPLEVPR